MKRKPFPQSYWVREGLLCAGQYPGAQQPAERDRKLAGLLDCGIRRIISLIPPTETGANGQPFDPYAPILQSLAAARGQNVECLCIAFADAHTPDPPLMRTILDTLDRSIAAGQPVYLHCWGGHGRTGTVVGCYLIRHGHTAQAAIDQIMAWRKPLPRNHFPFENQQEAFVRAWNTNESSGPASIP